MDISYLGLGMLGIDCLGRNKVFGAEQTNFLLSFLVWLYTYIGILFTDIG
jgi:hypothetical protein